MLALYVRHLSVAIEGDAVVALRLLHEEGLERFQLVVIIAWAVRNILAAVPHGDGSGEGVANIVVFLHVLYLVVTQEGIAHEVPAGVLRIGGSIGLEGEVLVLLHKAAVGFRFDGEVERAILVTLENITLSALSVGGTVASIVVTPHGTPRSHDVGQLDVERESEEVPTPASYGNMEMQVVGYDIAVGNERCAISAVVIDIKFVEGLVFLALYNES